MISDAPVGRPIGPIGLSARRVRMFYVAKVSDTGNRISIKLCRMVFSEIYLFIPR